MNGQSTALGKILIALFPKFVERLVYLDNLQQKIVIQRWFIRNAKNDERFDDQCNQRKKLIELINQFNANKMWFMRRNGK